MIFITGDVHGDLSRFKAAEKAKISKNDTLLICGDFGFIWNGTKKEKSALKWIGKKRYNVLFVDGCNENHKLISEYEEVSLLGGTARKISGNLYCLKRGEVYTIDNKKVFAFGGGDAIDEFSAKKNDKALLPTYEEMNYAKEKLIASGDAVDIIITHDAPEKIRSFINMEDNEINHLHTFLEDVCQSVKFKQWYFGKYHANKRIPPCYNLLFTDIVKYKD